MGFCKWIEIDFLCIKISRNIDPLYNTGSQNFKYDDSYIDDASGS